MRAHLTSIGVVGAAADAIVRETSSFRHEARVAATVAAAKTFASTLCSTTTRERFDDMAAALLIAIDLMGVGGRQGVEGCGTTRAPYARELGKARWQASDGPAYRGAAWQALHTLTGGGSLLVWTDDEGDISVNSWGSTEPGVFVDVFGEQELWHPYSAWLETLAREGLRVSLGMDRWCQEHQQNQEIWFACQFSGESRFWALFLNRVLEARASVVNLLERRDQERKRDHMVGDGVKAGTSATETGVMPHPSRGMLTMANLREAGACESGIRDALEKYGLVLPQYFAEARIILTLAGCSESEMSWVDRAEIVQRNWDEHWPGVIAERSLTQT